MQKTNERIFKQHSALVDVIQWLDSNGHSDKPIREIVNQVLNGLKTLQPTTIDEIKKLGYKIETRGEKL